MINVRRLLNDRKMVNESIMINEPIMLNDCIMMNERIKLNERITLILIRLRFLRVAFYEGVNLTPAPFIFKEELM